MSGHQQPPATAVDGGLDIVAAHFAGAETERAAIVAWLRDAESPNTSVEAADAIERGEHHA